MYSRGGVNHCLLALGHGSHDGVLIQSDGYDYPRYFINDAFDFGPGQSCEIFKADSFGSGDEIIYIPDTSLNEIPMNSPITGEEIIEEVVDNCYTGDDFIELCAGNEKMARSRLQNLHHTLRDLTERLIGELDLLAADRKVVDAIYAVNDARRTCTLKTED